MDLQSLLPSIQAIEDVLDRDVKAIPTLPVVATKLLEIARDDGSSAIDLAKVVATDPAITARVLKIVNSAAYGLRHKISSVSQAIVILGFSAVRTLALGVALFKLVRSQRSGNFDQIFFWKHCLSVAALSMALAEEIQYPDPEEAYVAGLLHDVGKMILEVYGRIRYGEFLKNLTNSDRLMVKEERKLIGLSHDDIGAYFGATWDMPDRLILAIKLHHQRFDHLDLSPTAASLIAIVSLSNFIAWTQGLGSTNVLRHPILQPEVEEIIDLNQLDLNSIVKRMDREVKSTAEFYNFTFPAPNELRENLLRANIDLSRMTTKYYYLNDYQKKELQSLSQLKKSIIRPHRSLDSKEIIASTLEVIHQEFDFDRLYVMKLDQTRRSLITIGSWDTTALGMDFSSLEIPIYPDSNGFTDCLRKQLPILITGKTRSETKVLEFLQAEEMGIIPISNNNQIIGIIGVDNVFSDRPIQPAALSAVAIIANELGMALEHAQAFEELKARAYTDALTQVHNRASIDEHLTNALNRAKAGDIELSLAMLDVDHFKTFNDKFGHLAGDSILKLLAGTVIKFSRPTCQVGRFGGEEFIIILNDTGSRDAIRYAERIRKEVENLGKLLTKRFPGHYLTVSIGLTTYSSSIRTREDLIAYADQALYRAKEAGRNKVMSLSVTSRDN